MSYILDALKKIEIEKNKKIGPGGRGSISGDLFQERNRPPAKYGILKIVLLVLAVSLVTGVATWLLLPGNGRQSTAVAPPPPTPVATLAALPAVPLPVQTQAVPVVPPPVAPVATHITETAGGEEPSPRDVRRPHRQAKAQLPSPYPKQTVQTVQPPVDIKLSGIAWQDERAGRRAVINGFLLKESSVVSGAKIIDIRADRVRFSSSAGQFEIKLDAVLPVEVKR